MTSPIYEIRDLIKEYNGRRVLDIPHLEIIPGEIFALVGPSGAGKSTLLRLMNFLEAPTTGQITFLNHQFRPDSDVPLEIRRRVTTVFQRPILLNQTVAENVVYGLHVRGKTESNGLCKSVLEQVGLAHLAQQRARTLSGGEAQRVALARAMIIQPDVLLLDEPTANLDPFNISLIEEIARNTNQTNNTTLVLVTHNIFQARRLANRIALMLDGKIIEVTDTEHFFQAPDDPRTAAFVRGDMVY
jgi:tungstate transport system ATP-binding protein